MTGSVHVIVASLALGASLASCGADRKEIATCNSYAQVVKNMFVQRKAGVSKEHAINSYEALFKQRYADRGGPAPEMVMILIKAAADSAYSSPASAKPAELAASQYLKCVNSLD